MTCVYRCGPFGRIALLGLLLAAGNAGADEGPSGAFLRALETAGWEARRLHDGAVELRARGRDAAEAPTRNEAGGARPAPDAPEPPAKLWERLRGSGWRVEVAPDGSTLLYPPAKEFGVSAVVLEQRPEPPPAPRMTLDDYLSQRGWRVERAADGSLLLYPRSDGAAAEQKSAPAPCPGYVPLPISTGELELPVDAWSEAKVVAESWLSSVDGAGLSVGRIRRLFRVFVVSIVDARPPHELRHQIAVNAADGRVVVLN